MKQFVYITALQVFAVSACKDPEATLPNPAACDNTNYTFSDVQYIFENACVGCHSYPVEAVVAGDFSSYKGVEASLNANQNTFLSQILWEMNDSDYNMPSTEKMSDEDIQKFKC